MNRFLLFSSLCWPLLACAQNGPIDSCFPADSGSCQDSNSTQDDGGTDATQPDLDAQDGNVQHPDNHEQSDSDGGVIEHGDDPTTDTPVASNGMLSVCGTQLCNQEGRSIQLRGMSTHGMHWYGWGDCVNDDSIDALAQHWGADILRVSTYVQEGGYETNPQKFRTMVDHVVDATQEQGIYCLIDWHMLSPGDPWHNIEAAKEFFSYMTEKHGSKKHVLFEICNEPNGVEWDRIRTYAAELIPLIRKQAPDSIVIVGTPDWSSLGYSGAGPADLLNKPLAAALAENVMYAVHFYAASHKWVDQAEQIADQLPLFATEWGAQNYAGEGDNDIASANAWVEMMARKKISWCIWNYSDDHRSGAVFQTGTCPWGPWTGNSLKQSGQLALNWIQHPPDDF